MTHHDVAAFYKFVALEDLPTLQATIKQWAKESNICGSLLIAPEGINATVAGEVDDLPVFMQKLYAMPALSDMETKYSTSTTRPFKRMKVRLKEEIIRYNQPQACPLQHVGQYVEPKDWNALISDPDVVLVDTRNRYETMLGMFKGAMDPDTTFFTQLPDWVQTHLNPEKNKKVAMYCTGGIRCEKSTSLMIAEGFDEVYHLKGGILKYLEDIPEEESLWEGECFVFDERVALTHGLKQGVSKICYGCGHPLHPEDKLHDAYQKGVSCEHCIDKLTPDRARVLEERHADYIKRG